MINTRNVVSSTTLLSASVVCLATLFLGTGNVVEGSVEDVLAGLSTPDLNNLLADLEEYPVQDYSANRAPEYDNAFEEPAAVEDEYYMDSPLPSSIEDMKHVEQRADVRADVPKHAGLASQQKAAHSSASAVSAVLPAYCDPPNPCPLGYTNSDGCIEGFENTSEFSRRYQSTQNCICDTEHMFNCPSQSSNADDSQSSPSFKEAIRAANEEGFLDDMDNPYLTGEKLHVAAKKGLGY